MIKEEKESKNNGKRICLFIVIRYNKQHIFATSNFLCWEFQDNRYYVSENNLMFKYNEKL